MSENISTSSTFKNVGNIEIMNVNLFFEIFFTDVTIVAEPLPEDMPE